MLSSKRGYECFVPYFNGNGFHVSSLSMIFDGKYWQTHYNTLSKYGYFHSISRHLRVILKIISGYRVLSIILS